MEIRVLPQSVVSKIAAGEIIEKPSNAVKELIENSIDAHSQSIKIELERAGKNLIRITDDGSGMEKDDLPLTVRNHATSKLPEDNLYDISSLGFRGEALHSISVVSELKIASSKNKEGYILDASSMLVTPHPITKGSMIEVRNLFSKIPNKLRFLRSEQTELSAITEIVNKLALVNHSVAFDLVSNGRQIIKYSAADTPIDRMGQIRYLGQSFVTDVCHITHKDGYFHGEFFFGVPTLNSRKNNCIIFANNRPIKDQIIQSVIKNSYADYVPNGMNPTVVMFITVPNNEIDVNIHPNKSEIKFHDPILLRNFVKNAAKIALYRSAQHVSSSTTDKAIETLLNHTSENKRSTHPYSPGKEQYRSNTHFTNDNPVSAYKTHMLEQNNCAANSSNNKKNKLASAVPTKKHAEIDISPHKYSKMLNRDSTTLETTNNFILQDREKSEYTHYSNSTSTPTYRQNKFDMNVKHPHHEDTNSKEIITIKTNAFSLSGVKKSNEEVSISDQDQPLSKKNIELGTFKCQIHDSFIISETDTEMIIIDQHAAHERIIYETLKQQIDCTKQYLLYPEFIPIGDEECIILDENSDILNNLGIKIEKVSHDAIMVHSCPKVLAKNNIKELVLDIASLIQESGTAESVLERIYANISCKKAIKANHKLTQDEAQSLISLMENTPNIGQCNHGRPTYIKLPRKNIEQLFLRT